MDQGNAILRTRARTPWIRNGTNITICELTWIVLVGVIPQFKPPHHMDTNWHWCYIYESWKKLYLYISITIATALISTDVITLGYCISHFYNIVFIERGLLPGLLMVFSLKSILKSLPRLLGTHSIRPLQGINVWPLAAAIEGDVCSPQQGCLQLSEVFGEDVAHQSHAWGSAGSLSDQRIYL